MANLSKMKIDELKELAEELEIEGYEDMKADELRAAIKEAQEPEEAEEEPEEEKEEKGEPEAPVKGGKAVDVIDRDGNYIRTYDSVRHGKDFKKLAEEFIKEVPDTPDINKGRKIVANPFNKVTEVSVVNETGKVVRTFSQKANGFGFREEAARFAQTVVSDNGKKIVGRVEENR